MGLKQHHFVLVHGAGHGAWCWVKVVAALEKAGHRATAVDLASAGESKVQAVDVTSLELYNQPLEDLIASLPENEKVILVGHSLGGLSLTRISELFPKKVSVGVYLSAFMPPPGSSLLETIVNDPSFIPPYELTYSFKVAGGPPTSQAFTHPAETLKEYFYNKSSPEDLAFAVDHCRVMPFLGPLLGTVHATKENYGSVPRVYVLPKYDKAIPPATACKTLELNTAQEVIEVDTDHSLFLSAVETVETILTEAAAKYDFEKYDIIHPQELSGGNSNALRNVSRELGILE